MVVLKTSKELSDMKLSCKISAQALKLAGELIKPGAYIDADNVAFLDHPAGRNSVDDLIVYRDTA